MWLYIENRAVNRTAPERAQMLALLNKDFKSVPVSMFKELKETKTKELM